MRTAYFVYKPRTIDELKIPHLASQEKKYEVVAEKLLSKIDYENFITDMLADRQFIEESAPKCRNADVMKCLLVRGRGEEGGILVVANFPQAPVFVQWAAYISEVIADG